MQYLIEDLNLGGLLEALRQYHEGYTLIDHWQQGEFHHDIIVKVKARNSLPGDILVISTNCNGGIKEILSLQDVPERYGLWHYRCPNNPEFEGNIPIILEEIKTIHWFNPCVLLTEDARSEMKVGCRKRQLGGGWESV
jgi:hypothetical protein